MDYSTWSGENLAAEERQIEKKMEELQSKIQSYNRLAEAAFDERDRHRGNLFGGQSRAREAERSGFEYQEKRGEAEDQLAKLSQSLREIKSELGKR